MWQKKIHGPPPPQNSEEEQSPLSDSEPEQGPILPTQNQKNREMQLVSTMQDNCNDLLGQRNRNKNTPINRKFISVILLDFGKKKKKKQIQVCKCNMVISLSP